MDSRYIIVSGGSFINEDELYHWGIKGMRWGVRRYQNKDGTLTKTGRKRYSESIINPSGEKIKNPYVSASKSKVIKDFYDTNEEIRSSKKKLLEADKLGQEYFSSKELQLKYKRIAAKEFNKKYNWGLTDKDIDNDKYWIWDDWDQGDGNSFSYFLKDRGVNPKEYSKKLYSAQKEYESSCKSAVDKMLSSYGDTPIKYYRSTTTLSDVVNNALIDLADDDLMKRNMFGKWET